LKRIRQKGRLAVMYLHSGVFQKRVRECWAVVLSRLKKKLNYGGEKQKWGESKHGTYDAFIGPKHYLEEGGEGKDRGCVRAGVVRRKVKF